MNTPSKLILISFTLGTMSSYSLSSNPKFLIIISLIILIYIYYTITHKILNRLLLASLFFILGFVHLSNFNNKEIKKYINTDSIYIGKIVKKDEYEEYNSYVVKLLKVNSKNKTKKIKDRIKISSEEDISLGSIICFNNNLKEIKTNKNEKLFNYKTYMKTKNIFAKGFLKRSEIIKIRKNKSKLVDIKIKVKKYINNTFNTYLNEENAKLIKSIILADSKYLEKEERKLYNNLGLSHILAVSGLHISIISTTLIYILTKLNIHRDIKYMLVIIFLMLYGYIIDFQISIIRATTMLLLIYIAKILHKPWDIENNLYIAAFVSLVINPYNLFSVSFQLSYIATAGIVIIAKRISYLKIIIPDIIVSYISVKIALLPIEIYYFNKIKLLSLFSNLIIVPIISLGLMLSFLLLITNIKSIYISKILALFINKIFNTNRLIINIIDKLNILNLNIFSPDYIYILIYYLIIYLGFRLYKDRDLLYKFKKPLYRIMILSIATNIFIGVSSDNLYINFIDVGQGDCILLTYKNKKMLFDTGGTTFGSFSIGDNITRPYLIKNGISSLDKVFISHFHLDHYEALFSILEEIKVKEILSSYKCPDKKLNKIIKDKKIDTKLIKYKNKIKIDKNLQILILHPDKTYEDHNNMSLVGLIIYKDKKILLTGDIEREGEIDLSKKIKKPVNLNILKVAHHGSNTSTSCEFLEKFIPDISVIQVGKDNKFNHPNIETLEKLKNIYRMDIDGEVRAMINSKINIRKYNDSFYKIKDILVILLKCIFYSVIIYILIKKNYILGEDFFVF